MVFGKVLGIGAGFILLDVLFKFSVILLLLELFSFCSLLLFALLLFFFDCLFLLFFISSLIFSISFSFICSLGC